MSSSSSSVNPDTGRSYFVPQIHIIKRKYFWFKMNVNPDDGRPYFIPHSLSRLSICKFRTNVNPDDWSPQFLSPIVY